MAQQVPRGDDDPRGGHGDRSVDDDPGIDAVASPAVMGNSSAGWMHTRKYSANLPPVSVDVVPGERTSTMITGFGAATASSAIGSPQFTKASGS